MDSEKENEYLEAVRTAIASWDLGGVVCSIRAIPGADGAEARHFLLRFGRPTRRNPIPDVTVPVNVAVVRRDTAATSPFALQCRCGGALTVYTGPEMVRLARTIIPRELRALEAQAKRLKLGTEGENSEKSIPLLENYEKTRL